PLSEVSISDALARVRTLFMDDPERARSVDVPATARIESGLRVVVDGPNGRHAVTDMATAIGGAATAGSPGWLLRAAHAACDATVIAMCAAEEGVELDSLEVTVDSDSDNRGLLGLDGAPAGPLVTRVRVRLTATGVPAERLRAIVERAESRSPVGHAVRNAVPVELVVATG
ncbi:MAG: osmotically inducible protein OsmC, partial [Anaerolinea sp.]|nr:osmotically inducible protein OsmC [Anaerolinea sp.]